MILRLLGAAFLVFLPQDEPKPTVLDAHKESVTAVAISSDGRTIATGGEDKIVKLWSVKKGETLHTLKGHTERVTSLIFRRKDLLASGSRDKTVKLWDVKKGECAHTLKSHQGAIESLRLSKNLATLVSAGPSDAVWWSMRTATFKQKIDTINLPDGTMGGTSGTIVDTLVSPDLKHIYWAKQEGVVDRADIGEVSSIKRFRAGGGVRSISLDKEGTLFAVAGRDLIRVYKPDGDKELYDIKAGADKLLFGLDGKILLCARDKEIVVRETKEGKELRKFSIASGKITSLALDRKGQMIVVGADDGKVTVWRLDKPLAR